MTSPGSELHRWAEEYRGSDLAVLTDPQVRRAVEDRASCSPRWLAPTSMAGKRSRPGQHDFPGSGQSFSDGVRAAHVDEYRLQWSLRPTIRRYTRQA